MKNNEKTFSVDEMIQFAIAVDDKLFKANLTGLKQFIKVNSSVLNSQARAKNRTLSKK